MAFLAFDTGRPFFDNNGNLLVGGKLRIYDATTTSYKTVYQDAAETTPLANNAGTQITFDSSGRLEQPVYVGSGAWKFTLETAAGVVFVTQDNIPGETVLTTSTFARPNMPVLSKSLSYTVLQDDIGSMIQADPTGGDVTITLISAVTAGNGAQIGVQHVGTAGKVIVAVPGGETVNGASTVTIRVPRAGAIFTSNAGVWSGPVTSAPFATLSKTTTYTVGVVDHGKTILADATGGAFTITLPAASDAGDGFEITIIKTDASANAVTVDGDGSETINGAANHALSLRWQSATLRCDGSNWQIKERFITDLPNSELASMAQNRIKGRASSGSGDPEDLTPANARTVIASDQTPTGKVLNDAGSFVYGTVVQRVYASTASVITVDSTFPLDNTIPQSNEGVEVLTASITPKVSSHRVRVRFSGFGTRQNNGVLAAALFRDNGADAIQVNAVNVLGSSAEAFVTLDFEHSPATTSSTTYKIRLSSSANFYLNGNNSGTRLYGGAASAVLILEEIAA